MILKLCDERNLPANGTMTSLRGMGMEIALTVIDGKPYAFQNKCPHQGAPLAAGTLDGCMVACPYHAWRFDVRNGQPEIAGDPPLTCYETRLHDGALFLLLPDPQT